MAIDTDFQRQAPKDEEEAKKFIAEVHHGVSVNGISSRSIRLHFGLDDEDVIERSKGDSGLYLALRRLAFRLHDSQALAIKLGGGGEAEQTMQRFVWHVDPIRYVDTSVLAIHYIDRMAREAKINGEINNLDVDKYVNLAAKGFGMVLFGDNAGQRYGAVADGLLSIKNRLVGIDLVRFKGK